MCFDILMSVFKSFTFQTPPTSTETSSKINSSNFVSLIHRDIFNFFFSPAVIPIQQTRHTNTQETLQEKSTQKSQHGIGKFLFKKKMQKKYNNLEC